MEQTIRKVSEFASPREKPLSYPGKRAGHSFVTDGELVMPLAYEDPSDVTSAIILTPEGMESLDEYLEDREAVPARSRYAVMGYGSNASPGALKSKELKDRTGKEIVPVINARIRGWDAAYSLMSWYGYAYADLTPEKSTSLEVTVTLLDANQMMAMSATEPNYALAAFRGLTLETGQEMDVYGYAGISQVFMPEKIGGQVAVRELPAENRVLPQRTQRGVLSLAIREFGLEERFGTATPKELSEKVRAEGPRGETLRYVKDAAAEQSKKYYIHRDLEEEANPHNPRFDFDELLVIKRIELMERRGCPLL